MLVIQTRIFEKNNRVLFAKSILGPDVIKGNISKNISNIDAANSLKSFPQVIYGLNR